MPLSASQLSVWAERVENVGLSSLFDFKALESLEDEAYHKELHRVAKIKAEKYEENVTITG